MRQSREEKAKTDQRIVELASARIRDEGLDGPGVAETMQAAGLTHGGFYKHFESRDDLIAEAAELLSRTRTRRSTITPMTRTIHLAPGSIGMSPRSTATTPALAAAPWPRWSAMLAVQTMASAPATRSWSSDTSRPSRDAWRRRGSRRQALITASTLVGSLTLARVVDDEALSQEILSSVRETLRHRHAPTE